MVLQQKQFAGAAFQLQAANRQIDFAGIPPFLRVLLSTDGTVTSSLEAYFWESVSVDLLSQQVITLAQDAPAIALKSGDKVLTRSVLLRGCETETIYVRAESLIRMDVLSPEFRADLQAQRLGIGELLRECGLETYREVLAVNACDEKGREVERTYRIVMEHQPFIQIKEIFPVALFR